MEYFVAESFRNWDKIGNPFEVNGKMYQNLRRKCGRCGGFGRIQCYSTIDGGICYECTGSGIEDKTVRAYTEKEMMALERAKERRVANAAVGVTERFKESNGFNSEDKTYVYVGNTYACKDSLKAAGAKYNPDLGWHSPQIIDIPDDCKMYEVDFNDLYNVNEKGFCQSKINIKNYVKQLSDEAFPPEEKPEASGEFLGEIGDRLRNINVTVSAVRSTETMYGTMNIYSFKDENSNTLVWMTSSFQDIEPGQKYILSGTVKEHKVFNNINQTQLSRCRLG